MPHTEAHHLIGYTDLQTQSCIFNDRRFSIICQWSVLTECESINLSIKTHW